MRGKWLQGLCWALAPPQAPALCDPTSEHSALLHTGQGFAGVAGSMGTDPPASEQRQFESLCALSHSGEVPGSPWALGWSSGYR